MNARGIIVPDNSRDKNEILKKVNKQCQMNERIILVKKKKRIF